MNEVLTAILEFVQGVEPWLRILIAAIAIMLETSVLIGLIVPGDTVVIVSAMGVTSLVEGIILGAFVVVGALAGESIGYAIGRWAGPHLQHSWLGRRIGERNWERAEVYLRKRGGIAIFLSRFLPVMHSLVPMTVGMSRYPYRKFIAWTLPACVLWTSIYISIAAGAAETYRELADSAHWAGYVFFGIIALGLLLLVVGKKVLHWYEHRHMKD
ncbi:DedA family protein [Microbacterium sp. G2-8]|uniref:DedA family protein n=1 Tax=Microbacterium sp. G2-8 TaxID=2842454 RepID=UPI001C8AF958|nr:DedA family protein [Microbacterium sp. G2-8]